MTTSVPRIRRGQRSNVLEAQSQSSLFSCILDDQPSYLVPSFLVQDSVANDPSVALVVNPFCWFSWTGSAPSEVEAAMSQLEGCARSGDTVWVSDPVTRAVMPFWLGQRYTALLWPLRRGDAIPPDFPAEPRAVLTFAGVLADPRRTALCLSERQKQVGIYWRQFADGYVPVRHLIHPYHLGALRRYVRWRLRTGAFPLGDRQSSLRYVAHDEPVMRFFHHQLTHMVGRIVGEEVKPSYVYLAAYRAGAELPKHVDREQCEYSITLLLDHSPEPKPASPWPIHLDTVTFTVIVFQAIGDGLIYRGRRFPHYRRPLSTGLTSTSVFFHYVPRSFTGSIL